MPLTPLLLLLLVSVMTPHTLALLPEALSTLPPSCQTLYTQVPTSPHSELEGSSPLIYLPIQGSAPAFPPPNAHNSTPRLDLSNKHIFFYGDSTTRQIYGAFLKAADAAVGNMNFEELKGHVRNDCRPQLPVQRYFPPPTDGVPCQANEVTCLNQLPLSAFGSNTSVTLDWKHLIYEDYDRYLFDHVFKDPNSTVTKPDIIVLSPGLHDCFHAPNDIQHHLHAMESLAHHLALLRVKVVWVDVSMFRDFGAASQMDAGPAHRQVSFADTASCIAALNQKAQRIAKHYGWLFFSRNHWAASNPAVQLLELHLPDAFVEQYVSLLLNHMACHQYF